MILKAILCAVLGLVIGFCTVGFGAAMLLDSIRGSREGAAAMYGFFFFGPIGAIVGALLAAGLVLRFGGGSAGLGNGLMIGSGVVAVLGCLLLVVSASPDRPSYAHVIEFQMEVPAATLTGIEIPGPNAMWGAAGGDLDDKPISQFFEKQCDGETCVLNGSVAALGDFRNFRIAAHLGPKKYRCVLGLPVVINAPADWSAWLPNDDARFRWRIVKR